MSTQEGLHFVCVCKDEIIYSSYDEFFFSVYLTMIYF